MFACTKNPCRDSQNHLFPLIAVRLTKQLQKKSGEKQWESRVLLLLERRHWKHRIHEISFCLDRFYCEANKEWRPLLIIRHRLFSFVVSYTFSVWTCFFLVWCCFFLQWMLKTSSVLYYYIFVGYKMPCKILRQHG